VSYIVELPEPDIPAVSPETVYALNYEGEPEFHQGEGIRRKQPPPAIDLPGHFAIGLALGHLRELFRLS
jgi:hypothetical protein